MRIAIDPFKKHRPQRPLPGVELTFRLKLSTILVTEEMHVSPRTTEIKTSEPVLDYNSYVPKWQCATPFLLDQTLGKDKPVPAPMRTINRRRL
jgi:hypothetical protein